MPQQDGKAIAGFALTRIIVPLWVLAGAIFKLIEANPANLPKGIWREAAALKVDLDWLLVSLISIEFLLVAVMLFMAKWARAAAIFVLSVFCLVLLNEMRIGNFESCGCLGKIPMKPWQMLAIDGLLLVGVIATGIMKPYRGQQWRLGPAATALFTLVGVGVSVTYIIPDRRADDVLTDNGGTPPVQTPVENGAATTPSNGTPPTDPNAFTPARPPRNYVTPDSKDSWIGKNWWQIDLLQYLPRSPVGIEQGTRYIIFYSRSCEHCEEMFWNELIMPIGAMVTAVEIPGTQSWELPATQCELMSLPTGTNWLITPPLAIKVVDGVVTCAQEGGHLQCFDAQ